MPLPTDNIYKFYAIFGLVLLISCFYFFCVIHNFYNDRAVESYVELETLRGLPQSTQEQAFRRTLLEELETVSKSDKKFYLRALGTFMGIGLILVVGGFSFWHIKIQPMQDRLTAMQIRKLELEIEALSSKPKEQDTSSDSSAVLPI